MDNICIVADKFDEYFDIFTKNSLSLYKITVFCVGDYDLEQHQTNKCKCKDLGVDYIHIDDSFKTPSIKPIGEFTEKSHVVYYFLKDNHFDFVIFDLVGAYGFFAVQAGKNSKYFADTKLIVYANKTSQWLMEDIISWNPNPVKDAKLWYAERYCALNCDYLLISTNETKNWLVEKRWDINKNHHVLNNLFEKDGNKTNIEIPKFLFAEKKVDESQLIWEKIRNDNPLVSICVPHYNHDKYFAYALESVSNITYKNIEVIIVDDGSTKKEAIDVFDELKIRYNRDNWNFYKKENEYAGKTRNFLANKAKGKYIVFLDADNLAKPNMINDFVYGIYKSNADCLTCHVGTFVNSDTNNDVIKLKDTITPLGPILDVGIIENVFGDTNCIIKKEVFLKIGGFATERLPLEDWEFLARINLSGFKQDVIPDNLFWYRDFEGGVNTFGHDVGYKCQHRIFSTYTKHLPTFMHFMFDGLFIPLYYKAEILKTYQNEVTSGNQQIERSSSYKNLPFLSRVKLAIKVILKL